jgi:tetratricopeptide (TPR) repeat protein
MKHRIFYLLLMLVLGACSPSAAELNNRGNGLTVDGQFDSALREYQSAQVLEPDNALLYFNAAEAYARAERIDEAQATLQQAIQRGDEQLASTAHFNIGNLHFQLGDYEAAIESYQEALRLNPYNEDARYNLEFALASRVLPTPTEIEMQTNPEQQQVNPTATPTPNPSGQELPTATPTPTPPEFLPPPGPTPIHEGEDEEGDEDSEDSQSTPIPRIGDLSVDDAKKLLEPIEANQEMLSTFRENYNRNGRPESDKDW